MNLRETAGRFLAPSIYAKLDESVEATIGNLTLVSESFQALADLAKEDRDFVRIGENYNKFFSPSMIKDLIMQARMFYLKNPIVKRGVDIQKFYVFGKGVTVRSDDTATNDAIQEFFAVNEKLLGNVGLCSLESKMQTDGNIFVALFTDETLGTVQVRRIDALEITRIVCHPEDVETELAYLREWSVVKADGTTEQKKLWYPAMNASPEQLAVISGSLGGQLETTPVFHQHIEALGTSAWGIPEFYAAIDWARGYKEFLEGWSAIQSIFRGFAFQANTDGGQKKIEAVKNALQTSISTGDISERNPTQTGSTFVGGANTKLQSIKTAGSTEGPEEARRLFLMAVMVFGAPETMFGDASVGTLATATALDRPTELKFKLAQERWKVFLRNITEYAVMKVAKQAPGNDLRKQKDTNTQASVIVEFPDILEHDIANIMKAAVSFFTLDGKTPVGTWDIRGFALWGLQLLGVDDPETVVEEMYPKDSYKREEWASLTPEEKQTQVQDMAALAAQAAQKQPSKPGAPNATESALAELARIGEAILKESNAGRSA